MPTETRIHAAELAEIVESIFGTMVHLEVCRCQQPWSPDRERLTSAVHLTGDWCGAVLLECTRRQACRFAARFLSNDSHNDACAESAAETSAMLDDVVRDVIGELANMIGGNLKCVLTRGTHLSMPSVIDGDYSLRVCGAEIRERLAFQSGEGFFWITVLATKT